MVLSDDEDASEGLGLSVIGKVLLHLQTIMAAMKPAWGNPKGIHPRSAGETLFIVDFMTKCDSEIALNGTPWMVGKHVVLLQKLNPTLKPCFDKMDIWVRVVDLPFDWMNDRKGKRTACLGGTVDKVDVGGLVGECVL